VVGRQLIKQITKLTQQVTVASLWKLRDIKGRERPNDCESVILMMAMADTHISMMVSVQMSLLVAAGLLWLCSSIGGAIVVTALAFV
jgi:hypothetical protein